MAASRASSGTLASVIEKTVNGRRAAKVAVMFTFDSCCYPFLTLFIYLNIFSYHFDSSLSFLYSLDAVPVDILCLKERRC
jgi:hypothetical protein